MGAVKEEYTTIQNLCWEAYADGMNDAPLVLEFVVSKYRGGFQVELPLIEKFLNEIREQLFNVPVE